MIKVYFDWNVMAQMKNGFHCELKEIVFKNENLYIPYSTSHVNDIFSSYVESVEQVELINSDLDFISELTRNTFLFNDGKDILVEFAAPIDYFNQLTVQRNQFKDISIDNLLKNFEDDPLTKDLVESYLNLLKAVPLDNVFEEAFQNPDSAQQMEIMFPGLMQNPTIEGFFQSFSALRKGLNEDEKYKELRKILQSGLGINRDKLFDSKAPYKIIESKYKQLGQDKIQHNTHDKNAPQWFNEITNEYLLLDMHGYQEDNVNIHKGRKETFKNTTEDAFHAAFASTCNFYIVNDKKSYKKTIQIFEKLRINTVVLKPDEFVKYYKNYLDFKDPNLYISIPFQLLQNGQYYEEKIEGAILRTYYFPYFIFNFFTKLILLLPEKEDQPTLLLSRNKPTNGTTYILEITMLVEDLCNLLGPDINRLGKVKEEEFKDSNWVGRTWKQANTTFRLVNPNGHFQLYIELEDTY
jgi:hypothetical protein